MARVDYIDPIHHLSGKIARRHKTSYCYRQASEAKYTTQYRKSKSEPTAAQVAAKQKFIQAVSQTISIMTDVDMMASYRTAWKAQLKNGGKYSTLRGYIFSEVYKTL